MELETQKPVVITLDRILFYMIFYSFIAIPFLTFRMHSLRYVARVFVKSSCQKVRLSKNGDVIEACVNQDVQSKNEVIQIKRDIHFKESKGSLYAHTCPSCGAKIHDTISVTCEYCSCVLNATSHDWIITHIE
ncbi:MAG: hypothetical protein OEV66_06290 [Spirochaetia bacterium]|nr:hypothetical protein [Spirochaetia bacterium]